MPVHTVIDSESGAALLQFQGSPTILEIQEMMMEAIDFIVAQNKNQAVFDTSGMEVMFTLSLYWYRKEWFPLANRSGLKDVAIVLPEDFAQRQFIDRLNNAPDKEASIQFRFFTDLEEALRWFRELN